jgi:DUF1365 family protein
MESCLYVGRVQHRRFAPVEHAFEFPLFLVYLDLAELDRVFRGRWLGRRPQALARFRRGSPRRPGPPASCAPLVAGRRAPAQGAIRPDAPAARVRLRSGPLFLPRRDRPRDTLSPT